MKTNRAHHHPAPRPGLSKTDRADNATIAAALKPGPLAPGATGAAVRDLKRLLGIAGYAAGSSRTFDAQTAAALQQFQGAEGLPVTGQLDQASFSSLQRVELRVRTHKDEFLAVGQKSAKVAKMQQELETLGYQVTSTNGAFDRSDSKALSDFFHSEGKGAIQGPREVLTASMASRLGSAVHDLSHAEYRERVKPTAHLREVDKAVGKAVAKKNTDGMVGLGEGAKSESVKAVQERLNAAGFAAKDAAGTFGPRTLGAVEAFQKAEKLPITGRVDSATWAKLKGSWMYTTSATGPAQALDEKDGAVKRTQALLRELGDRKVSASGLYDSKTASAVEAFEKKHHLKATGRVDAQDLRALKAAAAAAATVPQTVPGQVGKWIAEAQTNLRNAGVPLSKMNARDIDIIIMHESSGNPNAQNNWDSNAAAGHPSIGLMQTIGPTFEAYKLPGHDNIRNPIDNIIAGVRYAIARYGSISNVPGVVDVNAGGSYVGY